MSATIFAIRDEMMAALKHIEIPPSANRVESPGSGLPIEAKLEKALLRDDPRFQELLDILPAAIYTTDAEGRLTYFNPAAVEFSGRVPELGSDSWCVTWKLYHPDGRPMPHDQCPMAIALKEGRIIRGAEAIAERPDGSRVWFTPYPTPLRDEQGRIVGGINMLLDITERKQSERALRDSQESLQAMFNAANDAIFILDENFNIISVNRASEQLYAYSSGELLKMNLRDVRAPEARASISMDMQQSVQSGGARWESFHQRSDGTTFPVEVSSKPFALGGRTCFVHVVRDVTQRKRAQEATARLAAIVQSSDDAIISKDLNSIIVSWNRGAERIFGYTAQEAIGQPITILMPPDRVNEESAILERICRGEFVDHYETVRRRKDGTLLDISLTVSPIADAKGQIVGASKVARDITERKRAEALMQCQKEALEKAALGTPLLEVLQFLARRVELHSQQRSMVAIHLLDPSGTCFRETVAPSLPLEYARAVDGMEVSSAAGPCCAAISRRQRVAVTDVAANNDFPAFSAFALPLGIHAGWSTPIFSSIGKVLGTVACYYPEARAPHPQDNLLGDIITRTASVIIERKQHEGALRESEDRFRAVADNISQLAWICDRMGEVIWYNRRWLDYTGLTFEEMKGWGWSRCHHPDHVDRVVASVQRSRDTGEPWEDTFPLRGKDGNYRWFLSRAFPIRSASGQIVRWFGTNTDITELRDAQEALRAAQEELRTQNENLEQAVAERTAKLRETIHELESYSYSISHDMRAPLRAMQTYAHVLLTDYREKLDAPGKRYLDRIINSSNRLDKLIQDVLSYSRIARGDVKLEPINLDRLIEDICDEYPSLRAAQIEIKQPLGSVVAAEALLAQALSNLLANAAKFVAPGQTPAIKIWSETIPPSASTAQSSIKLSIQDHGIGIAAHDQQRIFGIFARVYSEKEYEGTGIGLSIAKKAIERMGGTLGLASELGKGSTFWFQLPKA